MMYVFVPCNVIIPGLHPRILTTLSDNLLMVGSTVVILPVTDATGQWEDHIVDEKENNKTWCHRIISWKEGRACVSSHFVRKKCTSLVGHKNDKQYIFPWLMQTNEHFLTALMGKTLLYRKSSDFLEATKLLIAFNWMKRDDEEDTHAATNNIRSSYGSRHKSWNTHFRPWGLIDKLIKRHSLDWDSSSRVWPLEAVIHSWPARDVRGCLLSHQILHVNLHLKNFPRWLSVVVDTPWKSSETDSCCHCLSSWLSRHSPTHRRTYWYFLKSPNVLTSGQQLSRLELRSRGFWTLFWIPVIMTEEYDQMLTSTRPMMPLVSTLPRDIRNCA